MIIAAMKQNGADDARDQYQIEATLVMIGLCFESSANSLKSVFSHYQSSNLCFSYNLRPEWVTRVKAALCDNDKLSPCLLVGSYWHILTRKEFLYVT
ncbi:hypothetical protein ACTXT7_001673 [Hymenolepis weldensis]